MNTVFTILVTVLIFGFLIGIHELGHYIAARLFGVGIIEFSIGMGPKIYHREGKVNDFSVRALPIGGFVSMVGEYSDEIDERHRQKPSVNSFAAWKRLIIGLAGPLMNILLAFAVMAIYVICTPVLASTTVADKYEADGIENTSFAEGGLMAGDKILKVGSHNINVYYDLSYEVTAHGIKPLDITVLREGETVVLKDVKFPIGEQDGVKHGVVDFKIYRLDKNFGTVVHEAFFQPIAILYTTVDSIIDTFTGRYDISSAVGGPVAIGGAIGDTINQSSGIGDLIGSLAVMMVFISVSLGICNLLPIPVLDGGMILFCLIEIIFRKPVPKKIQDVLQSLFALLLFALMFLVCIKDIVGLF